MPKLPPDWTKTGTVVAFAEWIRKDSDALLVMVVRRDDSVLAADPKMPVADVYRLVEEYIPALAADLEKSRAEKRKAARLELGKMHE
jgi:hypothetical protein